MSLSKCILLKGKEPSIKRYHPWIFSGAVKSIDPKPEEGDLVDVYSSTDEYLCTGYYQIGSICVRIISFKKEEIDYSFWKTKIANAFKARQAMGFIDNDETNAYRLISAEGDGMPGLIVDFYNGVAVCQFHAVGMYLVRDHICKALQEVLGLRLKGVYNKSSDTLPFKAKVSHTDEALWGDVSPRVILEQECQFEVNWLEGQKTGFFLDQRENRRLVELYSNGRSVLNTFCYTGGFSVYAIRGGANRVVSVDSSKKAIELTVDNVTLNFGPNAPHHEAIAIDAFEYLKDIDNKFDLIILDPPAFAKHNNVLDNALQAYKRMNARAIKAIKPGGILFTFSCSQVVSKENFRKSVFAAAANCGREVRILHQLTQPADHAFSIYHPEGEYLKGLILYVE